VHTARSDLARDAHLDPLLDRFPAAAVLDALNEVVRREGPREVERLVVALERLVASVGATGAVLEIDAPPLRPATVRAGILRGEADPPPTAALALHDRDGRPLGALRVAGAPADPRALARAVELALSAARGSAEAARTRARLEALDDATRAIVGELRLDRVLQLIVDRLRGLVGAQYAALGITDARGRIETFITGGISAEERARIGPPPEGHGMLGLIIRERRPLRVDDIAAHPQRHGFPPHHPPMTSLLGVPIIVDGRAVGNLYLTNKNGGERFTEDDQELVEMFALRAGIAIDNARLHDQVGRLAIVDERERIGRDLHDGIIQSIYGVSLALEDVPALMDDAPEEAEKRLDHAIEALHQVIGDIREYILDLRPGMGRDDDVVTAIARLAEELRLSSVVDVDVDLDGGAAWLRALPPHVGADVVAITREALSNVARHSGATRATVSLHERDGRLVLEIADNGRGFSPVDVPGPDAVGRHQGLRNIRERAIGIGGAVRVESGPGAGARIILTLPVASATVQPAADASSEAPGDRQP